MSSSFHASTVDWLGCWIAAGQVKPGETIKVEADLGEQLGVSRTVIREAIKTLVAKGMLEVGPKVGTRVLPVRRWNLFDPQVVGWLSRSGLPENFVDDLLDLRRRHGRAHQFHEVGPRFPVGGVCSVAHRISC